MPPPPAVRRWLRPPAVRGLKICLCPTVSIVWIRLCSSLLLPGAAPRILSSGGKLAGQSSSTEHTVLRCCTVNLNGICNKMCSLTRLIKEHDFKIICVTEFHLTSSISNSIASIQHFQHFCKDALGDVEKHVVCVYVHDTLMVDRVSDISENALMFCLAS